MNAAHGSAVADAFMGIRVVLRSIDINKLKPALTVTPLQKANFPHTQRTAPVEKQGQFGG